MLSFEMQHRQRKSLQKINDRICDSFRYNEPLRIKWMEFMLSSGYRDAKMCQKAMMSIYFLREQTGESEHLQELIELALLMNPFVRNRMKLLFDPAEAFKWFMMPQAALKGEIPWLLMQNENGAKRARRSFLNYVHSAEKSCRYLN